MAHLLLCERLNHFHKLVLALAHLVKDLQSWKHWVVSAIETLHPKSQQQCCLRTPQPVHLFAIRHVDDSLGPPTTYFLGIMEIKVQGINLALLLFDCLLQAIEGCMLLQAVNLHAMYMH